jgi:hypothetical protein
VAEKTDRTLENSAPTESACTAGMLLLPAVCSDYHYLASQGSSSRAAASLALDAVEPDVPSFA